MSLLRKGSNWEIRYCDKCLPVIARNLQEGTRIKSINPDSIPGCNWLLHSESNWLSIRLRDKDHLWQMVSDDGKLLIAKLSNHTRRHLLRELSWEFQRLKIVQEELESELELCDRYR